MVHFLHNWSFLSLCTLTLWLVSASQSRSQGVEPELKWGTYIGGEMYEHSSLDGKHHKVVIPRLDRNIFVIGKTLSTKGISSSTESRPNDSGYVGYLASYSRDGKRLWSRYLPFIPEDIAVEANGRYLAVIGTTASMATLADTTAMLAYPLGEHRAVMQVYSGYGGRPVWESYYVPEGRSGEVVRSSTGDAIQIDSNGVVAFAGRYDVGDNLGHGFQSIVLVPDIWYYSQEDEPARQQPANYFTTPGKLTISDLLLTPNQSYDGVTTYLVGSTTDTIEVTFSQSGDPSRTKLTHQRTCNGSRLTGSRDGFLVSQSAGLIRMNTGYEWVQPRGWLSYYGGVEDDEIISIDASPDGPVDDVVIAGTTSSVTNIASSNADRSIPLGRVNGFVASFSTTGKRNWGTYVGGVDETSTSAVAVQSNGTVAVAGTTSCDNDVSSSVTDIFKGGQTDGFVALYSQNGEALWSRYIGGEGSDTVTSVAIQGDILACNGTTTSRSGIATPGTYRTSIEGVLHDAFLSVYSAPCFPSNPQVQIGNELYDSEWRGVIYCVGNSLQLVSQLEGSRIIAESLSSGLRGRSFGDSIFVLSTEAYGSQKARLQVFRNGCYKEFNVYVDVKEPNVTVEIVDGLFRVVFGDSIAASTISVRWFRNGVEIVGATAQSLPVSLPGMYTVEVSFGDTCVVRLGPFEAGTSSVHESLMRIYPNPTDGIVNISLDSDHEFTDPMLDIVNSLGQRVASIVLTARSTSIDLKQHAAPGVYRLTVVDKSSRVLRTEMVLLR